MKKRDEFVRMRKLLERRHIQVALAAKRCSARLIATPTQELRDEMLLKEGEKNGICYSMKVLDKACQMRPEWF